MNALTFDDAAEETGTGGFLAQLPAILWQRRWWIVVPLAIGLLAALAAIVLLPTTYRSTAIILVQSPQLPGEVIGATTDNGVDQRIARIREQVTSRPDLLALIDENGLYPGERSRAPLSKIIKKMRDAIELVPTTADNPGDPSRDNTISFALSFDYDRPVEAQAVAQALMERVLNLDASQKSGEAKNTVQFLTDQASTLQAQIAQIEGQVAAISARNGQALAGTMPIVAGGSGSYDVQISQLQRDNATLLAQRRAAQGGGKNPIVAAAEAQLAGAKAIYADTHPDVVLAEQRLAEAKNLAAANAQPSAIGEIDQQIAYNNAQIATLRAARAGESAQVSAAMSAQARGPLAQQQIAQLQQRLTGLNAQYQAVSERLLAARAGVRAADEQMGQRLSVIDPPVIPDTPYSPNRVLILAIGVVGGLGLGIMLALLAEFIVRPIRTPETLARIDGQGPLAVIPLIEPKRARRSRWRLPRLSRAGRVRRRAQGAGEA
jgi:uncharacterized protein involved in exopolysaccharide biosynthesis